MAYELIDVIGTYMKYGYLTVAAAIPSVKVGDVAFNILNIESQIVEADSKGAEVITFPELSITGYTCQDLFRQNTLIDAAEAGVLRLLEFTHQMDIVAIVGAPVMVGPLLLNCAIVLQHGEILGIVPKTYLPNYSEFYEKRWFASSQDLHSATIRYAGKNVFVTPQQQIFCLNGGAKFGIEICEDVWSPEPPSNRLALSGADVIFNLSASDELIGKHDYLKKLLSQQSARTIGGYVYSGCGFGESTQDVVYGGNAMIFENGRLIAESKRFEINSQLIISQVDVEKLRSERRTNSTYVNAQRPDSFDASPLLITAKASENPEKEWKLLRDVDPHPFIPSSEDMSASCEEIFSIQVMGLAKRLAHTHAKHVVLGISGGLDSTLALLVCVRTFDKLGLDRKGIVGVTMPGFGTTDRTYHNAITLMHDLGITVREINIAKAVTQHFEDIGHDPSKHDVTYENSQARERTQILMDVSNQVGGLVIGTGDLSELALGWCTYNGDHMSMYGVNVSIPKTLIRYLVNYVATTGQLSPASSGKSDSLSSNSQCGNELQSEITRVLLDIIDTPISPELTPADDNGEIAQKTEDLVGPYELHDFFLYYLLRFGFHPAKIMMLAKSAFGRKYPDGVIKHWLHTFIYRFFSQQFKRSCLPDGPKVGSVSLSPRGDWRMPSDAVSSVWLEECDAL